MAQHILTDPSKPEDAFPAPRNPIRAMNGMIYEDRDSAYLACQWDSESRLVDNLIKVQEFGQAKESIFRTHQKGSKRRIRIKDLQTYLRGNPFVGEGPLNPLFIEQIMELNSEWTVGDVRHNSEATVVVLYPTVHGLIERIVEARKALAVSIASRIDPVAQVQVAEEDTDQAKDQAAVDASAEDTAPPQVTPDPLPALIPGSSTEHGTGSSDQSLTPPRPVNADDNGFDEHVSYTAPELLGEASIDSEKIGASDNLASFPTNPIAGPSSLVSGPEQLRQARLARFEERQSSRASSESVATPAASSMEQDAHGSGLGVLDSPVKLGQSSRVADLKSDDASEEADGWETENSDGDPDRSSRSMRAQPSTSTPRSAIEGEAGPQAFSESERQRNLALAASKIVIAKTTTLTQTQAFFLDKEGTHVVDTNDGSRYPIQNADIPPTADGTHYFIRDPLRPDVPHRPLDIAQLPAFPPIPIPNPVATEDEAEEDAEDEEGEEDEYEDEPGQEAHADDHAHHHHDQDEMDELDREDWNGVLEGKLFWQNSKKLLINQWLVSSVRYRI